MASEHGASGVAVVLCRVAGNDENRLLEIDFGPLQGGNLSSAACRIEDQSEKFAPFHREHGTI